MKYFAYVPVKDGEQEPPQEVEMAVFESVKQMKLQMPPVRRGWFSGNKTGGQFGLERFPGSSPIWYWEVK